MKVDFNNNEPIYIQIIKHFKQKIILGELNYGDEIPSRRELAGLLKVNVNTIQRAYKEMEDLGMIETIRNFNSKIIADENKVNEYKIEIVDEAMEQFIKTMKDIKINSNEVIELIKKKWNN